MTGVDIVRLMSFLRREAERNVDQPSDDDQWACSWAYELEGMSQPLSPADLQRAQVILEIATEKFDFK